MSRDNNLLEFVRLGRQFERECSRIVYTNPDNLVECIGCGELFTGNDLHDRCGACPKCCACGRTVETDE